MTTQTASSSSSSFSSSWKYDVFLSFCGVDTRKNFTDHLYTALKQKGIITFKDDEKLERGKYISPELLKAIEESKYAIIVLSKNYASSRWCLIELAKIIECIKETKLIVLPVFYYVDPSDVRNQTVTFADTFAKHERDPKVSVKDVQVWKGALREVGNISGWHLHDRHESIVIQEILERIFGELNLICSNPVSKELVGIESHVRKMLDLYLDEGSGDVRFVGICGMGGMGKTTLALEIYERISSSFEASSFISDVRERSKNQQLVSLQKQLLSKIFMGSEINIWNIHEGINIIGNRLRNKKVLIVLDDVDGEKQLEALVGNHDWFGLGSRIIVTSRDSHLLRSHVDYIYTTKGLNNDEALQLFSLSAFKKPHPEEKYMDLSRYIVHCTNGLPLALKILGSLLFNKSTSEWKSAIAKLKTEPNKDILDILQISFDGLMDTQKELFLDIACFFKGKNKDCIRGILKSFDYHPDYNLGVLEDKSLITILASGNLWMHDLLQEMGHEIVRRESPKEPGRRTRLWIYEDVLHVLKNNTGTEVVEGIMLNAPIQKVEHLDDEVFSKMKKMRLLEIRNLQLPQGLDYLSNELRILEWHGYPLSSMPTNFQPSKLVELRMHWSSIKQLWKGIMILDELELIDLSNSQNLIETPNFSRVPNLKHLILRHCTKLSKIHPSLGNLKQLIQLDLNGCKCLERLPHKINLESLKVFILSGCSRLKMFPEVEGNMSCLSELYLNKTAIKYLPVSMEYLTGLIKLDLRDCSKLVELPENLGNIVGLEELDASGTAITRLPSSLVHLKNLRILSLHGFGGQSSNKLLNFPLIQRSPDPMSMLEGSLSGLWSLTKLNLSDCTLQTIPDDISHLSSLIELKLGRNNIVFLPKSIIQLCNLKNLFLNGCTSLRLLPELPLSIMYIDATECTSLETLSLRAEDDYLPNFSLLNCFKLIENQGYDDMLLTLLKLYLIKGHSKQDKQTYGLSISRSEIPKWFSHQNMGASVNLQVPSDLCNKLVGIAMCVGFVVRQHNPPEQFYGSKYGIEGATHVLECRFRANMYFVTSWKFPIFGKVGKIEQNHLWMEYFPSQFFGKRWKFFLSQSDVNGFSQIEIRFRTFGPGLNVTKCGACLVYEQDIEDLKQTMTRHSSCSITPYQNDSEDTAEHSNGIPPKPKWIQQPNLIENWIGNSCTQGQGSSDSEEEESQ